MKKIIASAFCLTLCFGTFTVNALHLLATSKNFVIPTDERKIIKTNELPQAVKTALEADTFKDWKVKEVTEVKIAGAVNRPDLATQYDVKLTKGKETKVVRFLENGHIDN